MSTCFYNVSCIAETAQAVLVLVDGEEKWVPKSVLADESEVKEKGDEGELLVADWFAEKELG